MLCARLDECESRRAGGLTSVEERCFCFGRRAHAYCAPRRRSAGVHRFVPVSYLVDAIATASVHLSGMPGVFGFGSTCP
jgi:hypothetical protein